MDKNVAPPAQNSQDGLHRRGRIEIQRVSAQTANNNSGAGNINITWNVVKEIRELHNKQGYTLNRISEIYSISVSRTRYLIYRKQHPQTAHLHRVLGQRGSKKPRKNVNLWGHLVCMCLKRGLPYRGFSTIELASMIKTAGGVSRAESEILDEVCADYGITFKELPTGKIRIRRDGE